MYETRRPVRYVAFLSWGFAVSAGNRDHRDAELAAVVAGQLLQRCQGVAYQHHFVGMGVEGRIVDHGEAGAGFQGGGGILVAIEIGAAQGKEDVSAFSWRVSVCTEGCCR